MHIFKEFAVYLKAKPQVDNSNKEQGLKSINIKLNWYWYLETMLGNE